MSPPAAMGPPASAAAAANETVFQSFPIATSSPKLVDFYLPKDSVDIGMDYAAVGDVGYGFFSVDDGSPGAGERSGSGYSSRRSTLSVTTTEEEEIEEQSDEENARPAIRSTHASPLEPQQSQQHHQYLKPHPYHRFFGQRGAEDGRAGYVKVPAQRFRPRDNGRRLAFARGLSTPEKQGIPIPRTQNLFSQDRELRQPSLAQDQPFSLARVKRFHARRGGGRGGANGEQEKGSYEAKMAEWHGRDINTQHYDSADTDTDQEVTESRHDADEGIFHMEF